MIKIIESVTKKVPGLSSLFVSFNYSPDIVAAIKQISGASYDKNTKQWEVPITSLSRLLDTLCKYDEIELTILPEDKHNEPIIYDLGSFKTKPFKYQEEGIQYGLNNDKFLLLDAPGLGKSLQIIYIAEKLKEIEGLEHCLIICGINTLKHNWKKEIERHSKLDCRILGERLTKKGTYKIGGIKERLEDLKNPIKEFFVIMNIETLRNSDVVDILSKGKINKFDMIAFDEIHRAKSSTSQQGKGLLKLKDAKHKIAATGTLLLNNPIDAYVPLKWIGADNSTFTNFKYYYCNYTGPFNNILIGYKNLDVLKEQLELYGLRRTKDLLELPPKNIIHEIIDMEDDQAKFYENVKNGVKDEVDKVELKTATILGMVTRLRQASTCPSILTTEEIPSAKIERACDLAREICSNDEKVVIFSEFKEPLNIMAKELEDLNPLVCSGDIKDDIISDNIDAFQNKDDNKVILCTISKMGTGITLTRASYAIFIGSSWTQAQNLQCEDRIYRIGSDKPVFIYYLWSKDTIDEHIKELVETKGLVSDYVIDDNCPPQLINKLKEIIQDL